MAENPLLAAAFLCERVLQEKDDVLTIVRMIDSLHVTIPARLPAGAQPMIQATAVLSFKKATPGTEAEKHQLKLQIHAPSGREQPPLMTEILFKPGEQPAGFNVIANFNLAATEFGLFWIDVVVNDQPMTRIPFRLLEKRESPPQTIH